MALRLIWIAVEQGINTGDEFLERLSRSGRGLQAPMAVDQKNHRVARDVAIEAWDLAGKGEQRIANGDLLQESAVRVDDFVR